MAITAKQVKELRDRTAAGMMDCKKALIETNGDIEAAIDFMRKNGQAKAAKKAGRIAAEGAIFTKVENGVATMLEFNCETDFVGMDKSFLALGNEIVAVAHAAKVNDIAVLNELSLGENTVEATRALLVAKIGENMTVRRVVTIEGTNLAAYVHGGKIGAIASLVGGDEALAKDVAMHVAAANPQYTKPSEVSADVVERERKLQIDIAVESGKPQEIAEKMVAGRMKKFTGEISLTGQAFIKDPSQLVGDLLKASSADVTGFLRFELGEGIEKKEEDFAAEVEATIAALKK
ncbi:MAG: elongation factor Ts [Gammaproteobacteria bacterium]|nr:elongation factor Ts [Gammaproteobacteria bacterium]